VTVEVLLVPLQLSARPYRRKPGVVALLRLPLRLANLVQVVALVGELVFGLLTLWHVVSVQAGL